MAPLDARAFGHRHARRRLHAIATQRPRRGRGAIISYAYVLASTARHRDRLSILDWGGGVGQFSPVEQGTSFRRRVRLPREGRPRHVLPRSPAQPRCALPRRRLVAREAVRPRRLEQRVPVHRGVAKHAQGVREVTTDHLFISRFPIIFRSPLFVVLYRAEAYGGVAAGRLTPKLGTHRLHLGADVHLGEDRAMLLQRPGHADRRETVLDVRVDSSLPCVPEAFAEEAQPSQICDASGAIDITLGSPVVQTMRSLRPCVE